MAIEIIQNEIATPSFGCKNASAGLSTGFVLDIGAPIAMRGRSYLGYPLGDIKGRATGKEKKPTAQFEVDLLLVQEEDLLQIEL
jgi:hypothetical protein